MLKVIILNIYTLLHTEKINDLLIIMFYILINILCIYILVRRGDVMSAWSGIRPLVSDPNKEDTQSLARNHIVHVSDSNLITIAGGKWTTYRAMAMETIDAAIKGIFFQLVDAVHTIWLKLHLNDIILIFFDRLVHFCDICVQLNFAHQKTSRLVTNRLIKISQHVTICDCDIKCVICKFVSVNICFYTACNLEPKLPECQTEKILMEGAHGWTPTMYIRLVQDFGLECEVAQHMAQSYGDRAFAVAKLASLTGKRWPIIGKKIHPEFPYIDAEIRQVKTWTNAVFLVRVGMLEKYKSMYSYYIFVQIRCSWIRLHSHWYDC